jgi:hypothetical protein
MPPLQTQPPNLAKGYQDLGREGALRSRGQPALISIKARWAAGARPAVLALAEALLALLALAEALLALQRAEGFGIPCTRKRSQAGRGQEA